MKPKKFFLPTFDQLTANMLVHHGHTVVGEDGRFDCAVFTGGADICPFLYGEKPIDGVNSNILRDREEIKFLKKCPTFTPKIGICRGAQLLNVWSGGTLWQDVDNHTRDHEIDVIGEDKVKVTSTHHQMMITGDQATVVGTANQARRFRADQVDIKIPFVPDIWTDPEIVFYWNTASLCFQPHPEYKKGDCQELFMLCVQDYLFEGVANASPRSESAKATVDQPAKH